MSRPRSVFTDGPRLSVGDSGNNCSGSYLDFPTSVRADDRVIYVSDTWHNRVLVFLR